MGGASACLELAAPGAVHLAIRANLTGPAEENVILVRSNVLEVYRVVEPSGKLLSLANERSARDAAPDAPESEHSVADNLTLELVMRETLHGCPLSVAPVAFEGESGKLRGDYLAISFSDAKLSICEFDPGSFCLRTVSLHSFETDHIRGGRKRFHTLPRVVVDPLRRCAAMIIYEKYLAITPLNTRDKDADISALVAYRPPDPRFVRTSATVARGGIAGTPYVVNLEDSDVNLNFPKHCVFLHGYFEPTLLVLHFQALSWSGRRIHAHDNAICSALSLNVAHRRQPEIWRVEELPLSSHTLTAVPDPYGGAIVLSANALAYVSQDHVTGFAVNGHARTEIASTHLRRALGISAEATPAPAERLRISLDRAVCAFLKPDLVAVVASHGDLLFVSLVADAQTVHELVPLRFGRTVQPSTACAIGSAALFVGSHVGDSVLLSVHAQTDSPALNTSGGFEPPQKRARGSLEGDEQANGTPFPAEDEDDLIYAGAASTRAQTRAAAAGDGSAGSLDVRVTDTLWAIAGVCSAAGGAASYRAGDTEAVTANPKALHEVCVASGLRRSGSLSLVRFGILPEIASHFDLRGCRAVFATQGPGALRHILLSTAERTVVMEARRSIRTITGTGFFVDGATLGIFSVGDGDLTVQVYENGVRLLRGAALLHEIYVGVPVRQCDAAGRVVALVLSNRSAMIVTVERHGRSPRLVEGVPQDILAQDVAAACLVRAAGAPPSPVYEHIIGASASGAGGRAGRQRSEPNGSGAADDVDSDEEEALLYGADVESDRESDDENEEKVDEAARSEGDLGAPVVLMAVCRANGRLELYSVPDFTLVFMTSGAHAGADLLLDDRSTTVDDAGAERGAGADGPESAPPAPGPSGGAVGAPPAATSASLRRTGEPGDGAAPDTEKGEIVEVRVVARHGRLFLFVAVPSGDVFAYSEHRFLRADERADGRFAGMRFRRCDFGAAPRLMQSIVKGVTVQHRIVASPDGESVFLCGDVPHMVTFARGFPSARPMRALGRVDGFARLRIEALGDAFVAANASGTVYVATMPEHEVAAGQLLVRRRMLRATPRHVTYFAEYGVYLVVLAREERVETVDPEFDDRLYIPVVEERFELAVFDPVTLSVTTLHAFAEHDVVTDIRVARLRTQWTALRPSLARQPLVVVGTSSVARGEMKQVRGHVRVFALNRMQKSNLPSQTRTADGDDDEASANMSFRAQLLYEKLHYAPISALCDVQGALCVAVGNRIFVYRWENENLTGMAFYDTQIYVARMSSVKSLVMFSDARKSVQLLRWMENKRKLHLLARDRRIRSSVSCDFVAREHDLQMISFESVGAVNIFTYEPANTADEGLDYLIEKSHYFTGSSCSSSVRLALGENVFAAVGFMHNGAVLAIVPVSDADADELAAAAEGTAHAALAPLGLNTKAFRRRKEPIGACLGLEGPLLSAAPSRYRGAIDGVLLSRFLRADRATQHAIAATMQTSSAAILDAIAALWKESLIL